MTVLFLHEDGQEGGRVEREFELVESVAALKKQVANVWGLSPQAVTLSYNGEWRFVHVCMYACIRVCAHMCVCVCVCVCMCVCVHMY